MKGNHMKKLLLTCLFTGGLLTAQVLHAQTPHTVTLNWLDAANPSGATYNVYRATGLCSGTPVFSKLATAVAVKTFVDSTVTPGNYCYVTTASIGGAESGNSNNAPASVLPFPPTGLNVTVQ